MTLTRAWRRLNGILFPQIKANLSERWRIALRLPCWCGRRGWESECRFQHGVRHHARHPRGIAYILYCKPCRERINREVIADLRGAWPELVGAQVARACEPVQIDGRRLVVRVVSSAWSHQLAFLEPEIVCAIGARTKLPLIGGLRFRVAAGVKW